MPVQNQFKPLPEIDLPFLNAWRDRMIEQAIVLGIDIPVRRELIDFEELFNSIKETSLERRKRINQINNTIFLNKKSGWQKIANKLQDLKKLVYGF